MRFELEALREQLDAYLRIVDAIAGADPKVQVRVALTDLGDGRFTARMREVVYEPLAQAHPRAVLGLDPERQAGRGYYQTACFKIHLARGNGASALSAAINPTAAQDIVGGYSAKSGTTLPPGTPQGAVRPAGFKKAYVQALTALSAQMTSQDSLYVYVAAHGLFDEDDQPLGQCLFKENQLSPPPGTSQVFSESLTPKILIAPLLPTGAVPFKGARLYIMVDSCSAGAMLRENKYDSSSFPSMLKQLAPNVNAIAIMTSGAGQYAEFSAGGFLATLHNYPLGSQYVTDATSNGISLIQEPQALSVALERRKIVSGSAAQKQGAVISYRGPTGPVVQPATSSISFLDNGLCDNNANAPPPAQSVKVNIKPDGSMTLTYGTFSLQGTFVPADGSFSVSGSVQTTKLSLTGTLSDDGSGAGSYSLETSTGQVCGTFTCK